MGINEEFWNALKEWQSQGYRSVEVKIDGLANNKTSIWCYDYEHHAGEYINSIEELKALDVEKLSLETLRRNITEMKEKFPELQF